MFRSNQVKPSRFFVWTMNFSRYANSRHRDFCKLEGIDLQSPIALNPQKTRVIAMRIRTIKSMTCCMIQDKSLDPSLEVEATSSTTHILNRSPCNVLEGKTTFEAWCGRKLVVKHF